MNYSTLGVVIHNKCNAKCDICSESCSPTCSESLDTQRVKIIIESCVGTSIKQIAFTGGEPFLEFNKLIDLVKCAKNYGFSSSVVTNGFWATSEEETEKLLKKIFESGLEKMNISYDLHHKKYIDQENINRIIATCTKYHFPLVISIVRLKGEQIGELIDGLNLEHGLVSLLIAPCQPAGRAKESFDSSCFTRELKSDGMKCPYDGILTIAADGNVYPCCSHQIFGSKLSIGNYMDLDAREMLHRIKNNGLLYILRNFGLDPFFKMNARVKEELPEFISSECEACEALFKNGIDDYLNDVITYIEENVCSYEKV